MLPPVTWVHEEETEGFRLDEGEVRPDFLARLVDCPPDCPPVQNSVSWWARGIVWILNGKKVVELGGLEPPTLRLPA